MIHRSFLVAALLVLGSNVAGAAGKTKPADTPAIPRDPGAVEVRVERARPQKEKHETLRFLKANRDFVRARYDLLRQMAINQHGEAGPIDPRFLSYGEMLAAIQAAGDSVEFVEDARRRQLLLASITELGELEARLDLMDKLLAEQQGRLGVLQADFTGRQQTALVVVVSGTPGSAAVDSIAIGLEDGTRRAVALTAEQREALRTGGVIQVFHGFVEPRVQVVEIALTGVAWPAGSSGFVELDPERDHLTLLRLDLAAVNADTGAAAIAASAWLHDETSGAGD